MGETKTVVKSKQMRTSREIPQFSNKPQNTDGFAYGKHDFSVPINFHELNITFEENNGIIQYRREIAGSVFQGKIATAKKYYYLEPVEPMNIPSHITDFLQIKFDEEILLEPSSSTEIYLTIPLGIGIFLESEKGEMNLLDMAGFNKQHFSLYGQPDRGVITRHHVSKVYSAPPLVSNYKEAILHVDIENKTDEWRKVGRVILYMKELELYYDSNVVTSCIEMVITSPTSAFVNCLDGSIYPGLSKCVGVYKQGKIAAFCNIQKAVMDKTFVMDMGLR